MLKDGHYMAWFQTDRGQGTGRVLLENGEISGGDTVISYEGTYQVEGSRVTGTLTTRRHSAGQPSIFGIDELKIKLAGTAAGNFVSCSGEVEQIPGTVLHITLIPLQEEGDRPDQKFDTADFHPEKLPKAKVR